MRPSSDSRRRPAALFALAIVVAALAASAAMATKRRAFMTSVSGSGDLASWPGATGATALDRADSICRARALAGGLPNAAAYRAWLSTSTTDAYCHVQGLGGQKSAGCNTLVLPGGGPWYLANGITNYTGALDDLTGPPRVIFRPVILDETLAAIPSDYASRRAWTGTGPDGTLLPGWACGDWTSSSSGDSGVQGDALGSALEWTHSTTGSCADSRRLLCLEPGASETTTLQWTPGAIAFVTSAKGSGNLGSWPQANGAQGIAAGDAICQHLAKAALLPSADSFVAWLSTAAVNAGDRVTTNGPFRRVDHYTVAGSHAELIGGAPANSIHVLEDGTYLPDSNDDLVWTGTNWDGTAGSQTCGGWVVGDGSAVGAAGSAGSSRNAWWTDTDSFDCVVSARLYCISNAVTLFWDGFEGGGLGSWSAVSP